MELIHPMISIIVPIYNVEKYLQQCIDSICTQTYPYLEIILVDDGSPDHCGDICDKNSEIDSRIVVIHKKNGGLSSARNVGLDIAKGKYISFVDADDTLHPKFIEILFGLCQQYDCDIAQCDFLCVAEDSIKLPLNLQSSVIVYNNKQALHELCSGKNAFKYSIAWNKIYKRELFNKIRYPLGRIHEDEFIAHLLLWKANKIVVTNQYLYYYLQRETSITNQIYSIKKLDALIAFKERANFLKSNKLENEYFSTLRSLIFLIEKHCILLKKNIKNYKKFYEQLLIEKKNIEKLLPKDLNKKDEINLSDEYMVKKFSYPDNAKIVLYGAGKWGNICYQWIIKNNHGMIVGWIDNLWYIMDSTKFHIMPIDYLLRIDFDYVLITIIDKGLQEEIFKNLLNWGITSKKVLSI